MTQSRIPQSGTPRKHADTDEIAPIGSAAKDVLQSSRAARRLVGSTASHDAAEADGSSRRERDLAGFCGKCEFGWIIENNRARRCPCTRGRGVRTGQQAIDALLARHRCGMAQKLLRVSEHTFLIRPGHEHIKPALDQYIRDLSADKRYGFFIYGRTNVGKSFAAAYVVNTVRHHRIMTAAMVNFSRSLSALQSTFGDDTSHQALLDVLFRTPLLAIDDLGMEYRAKDNPELSWAVSKFYQIIDFRRDEELPTIITSNRTPEELTERLGEPIMTRIQSLTLRLDIGAVAGSDPAGSWGTR